MISSELVEAVKVLKKQKDILIIFHKNPDGDALGSAVALFLGLKQLNKRCKIVSFSAVPEKFKFMFSKFVFDDLKCGFVVAVDLASFSLVEKQLHNVKINLVIDHHRGNSVKADYCLVDDTAAATCELIFGLLENLNVKLTKQIAMSLYVGLVTDTGCFKFSNTTSKTHEIASKLISFDFNFSALNFNLFDVKTKSQLKLQSLVIDNLEFYFDDFCVFVFVSRLMLAECGCEEYDFFVAIDVLRSVANSKYAIVLKEIDDFYFKASVRTVDCYDACEFCKKFGGGGHFKAAGFEIKGSLNEVKVKILKELKEFVV